MVDVSFSKTEVVISQSWIEIMSSKFSLQIFFDFLKTMTSSSPKAKVVLRCGSNCYEFKNDRNNHITVIGMLFCISLLNCIEIGPSAAE